MEKGPRFAYYRKPDPSPIVSVESLVFGKDTFRVEIYGWIQLAI